MNDGLIQVINFQMGQFPIGDNYVIPGLRENFYGKFCVNLGVLLPCVYVVEWNKSVPSFAQEYDCHIRERIAALAFGTDQWFEVTDDTASLATTVVTLLDQFGLPFLDQFRTYSDVVAHFDRHGTFPRQNSGRAALEAAIVWHELGDRCKSQTLFDKAFSTEHKPFCEYVQTLARRLAAC